MKKSLIFRLAAYILFGGAAIFGILSAESAFQSKKQATYDRLTQVEKCQIDVLAPFLRENSLGSVRPPQGTSFSTFIKTRIQAGKISEQAGQEILKKIDSFGLGEPSFTVTGWLLPDLANPKN